MIFNSDPWKRELKRIAHTLGKYQGQRRWSDASYARFEQSVMVGCYIVRRIAESFQPMIVAQTSIPLLAFPATKESYRLWWPVVAEHFDLSKSRRVNQSLKFIYDQMIHTYVFSPWFDENHKLAGVFFSSDREKDECVFRLGIDELIQVFENIATIKGKFQLRFGPDRNEQIMPRSKPATDH